MPYIGNSQVAGVHQNNFKILDDISSYTETFDGSSSSVVNTTNNTITVSQHRFYHGQRVTYNNGGGSNIGGLTSGTVYYAVADSHSTIKLAASLADALGNIVISLSSVGSGTSHTLNNSFDGVNKKFKLTHSGGNGVNLTNASHATIAINNVIQRPNLNDTSFTEGFAIEGGKNIVFKEAPTSADTFWGNTIAESVGTFDSTDHAIDTFTADGTTTNFSLSKIPPSIRDIHITLDGVTQHTTSFSLQGNVLVFSTAPANGTAIQVKHMGFVGATVSGVTGFYGRIGNVALQDSDILRGDGSLISNLTTIGGNTGVDFNDNVKARFGTGNDLEIYHNNPNTYMRNGGNLFIQSDNGDIYIQAKTNENSILCQDNGGVGLYHDNTLRAQTRDFGFAVYQDLDVDGHTNLDNVSIAGITTFSEGLFIPDVKELKIGNSASSPDFKISNNTASTIIREENSNLDIQASFLRIADTVGNYKLLTNGTGVSIPSGSILDVDGHTNLDNVNIAGVSTFSGNVTVTGIGTLASQFNYFGPKIGSGSNANDHGISLIYNGVASLLTFHDASAEGFVRSYGDLYFLVNADQSTGYIGGGYGLRLAGTGINDTPPGSLIPYTLNQGLPNLGRDAARFGTVFAKQTNVSGISTVSSLNVNNIGNYDGLKIEEGNRNTSTSLNGGINIYLSSGHVHIFTAATSGNYIPRLFYDGATTINSLMSDGDVITFTLMVASSSHYLTSLVIEGVTQTVEWVGGSAPSAANGSGYDIYSFTIMSTGGTSFIVFGNQVSAA